MQSHFCLSGVDGWCGAKVMIFTFLPAFTPLTGAPHYCPHHPSCCGTLSCPPLPSSSSCLLQLYPSRPPGQTFNNRPLISESLFITHAWTLLLYVGVNVHLSYRLSYVLCVDIILRRVYCLFFGMYNHKTDLKAIFWRGHRMVGNRGVFIQ